MSETGPETGDSFAAAMKRVAQHKAALELNDPNNLIHRRALRLQACADEAAALYAELEPVADDTPPHLYLVEDT